jgi:class 3 adenylate cyclase
MAPPETTRRLATILAADVVGYSRLMAEDEESTVRTLHAHREIIDRLIARHEGRIFNTAGDSVLAEFGSAVEAVRCATTIQDELRVRNAELPEARRMLFRIGINIGDVIVDGDNLLGDGINVAARLESIAQPGGVCISGGTFDQVKNKLSIGFEDLGPQSVKNIPDPVAAFRITGAPVSVSAAAPAAPERRGTSTGAMVAGAVVVVIVVAAIWLLRPEAPPPIAPDVASSQTDPAPVAPPAEPAAPVTPAVEPAAPAPEIAAPPPEPTSPPVAAPSPIPAPPEPPSQPDAVTRIPVPPSVAPAPTMPTPVPMQTVPTEEIAALVSGGTIRGTRRGDGRPFIIDLLEDGRGFYSEPRGGTESGTTRRNCGAWRVEDGQFCMQFRGFNKGKEACPTLLRQGAKLSAQRPDGEALDWTFSRDPAHASRVSRDPASTTSNEMCDDEIATLVSGRQISGRNRKDRPFTIELAADGVANLSVIRPGDRPPFRETGKWWTENYRFCMRFTTFGQGQDMCPRFLAAEGERIAMTKGDGTPLDWTLNR